MFENLRIVELSTVLAGPAVGMFFAELGANVVKIEHPEFPDVTRSWKLAGENPDSGISAYFASVNYQKKYQQLDLRREEDYVRFLDLIATADILLTNFKHGDDEKLKLTNRQLWKVNPSLIIGKISGFGTDSDRVAYDLILQAETGFMSMNGTPESGPVKMPVALIDILAAHQLKEGLLIALLQRGASRKGCEVSVSLYDAAVASLGNQASNYLMTSHVAQRIGSLHPNIAPYGEIFETADAQLITFAIGSDKHFFALMEFLGLDDKSKDERFSNNQSRVKNRTELAKIIGAEIKSRNASEILAAMNQRYVPAGIIRNMQQVFEDPQAQNLVRTETISNTETKRVSTVAFQIYEND